MRAIDRLLDDAIGATRDAVDDRQDGDGTGAPIKRRIDPVEHVH